jgi:hypothetical protein
MIILQLLAENFWQGEVASTCGAREEVRNRKWNSVSTV